MPAACHRRRLTRVAGPAALAALLVAAAAPAQPPAAALKLPDGTVVLLTKAPDDPNPPVDGVLLSGKEYQQLLDQAEQFRRQKDATKPAAPSRCEVRGKVEPAGKQPVAALTLTFAFRTSAPKSAVALGCGRGFPKAARYADGKLPVLRADRDGLAVLVEQPGDYALTVELEAPVTARGPSGELGFDVGLPRAPITTLSLARPAGNTKDVTVGVRTPDRPTETRRTAYPADRLAAPAGVALGPTELLEVVWDAPSAPAAAADLTLTADVDVAVRVDEATVETEARIRLRGPAREWKLVLPPGAEATAERADPPAPADPPADPGFAAAGPTLTPPTDPAKGAWTLRAPDGPAADWLVTATVRQPRPKPTEPKYRGPYPVGPFAVPAARVSGTAKVFAPLGVRVTARPAAAVRPQDPPAGADEDLVAVYRFADAPARPGKSPPPPPPLLEIDAAPAVGQVRVEPTYRLRRDLTDWRLDATVKVTPVRTEVRQLAVELPDGWDALSAGPFELVEQVQPPRDGDPARTFVVRLVTAQRTPFELTLTAGLPVDRAATEATVRLPRFPQAAEQGAKLTATVPDGLTLRGTASGRDRDAVGPPVELAPAAGSPAGGAVTSLSAAFEKGAAAAHLAWQPYRPELAAEVTAEVYLGGPQPRVVQTVRLTPAADAVGRTVRVRRPADAVGLTVRPPLDHDGLGDVVRPPAGAKEFDLSAAFNLPAADPGKLPVELLWPLSATRVRTTVRVWGDPTGRRVARYDGPWAELPPRPAADRPDLPWLTLEGAGAGLPLTLELADPTDGPLPAVWVERLLVQARVGLGGEEVARLRARFLLTRWPAGGVVIAVPVGATPDVRANGVAVTNLSPVPNPPDAPPTAPQVLRVPLPDGDGRTPLALEVAYPLPAAWVGRGEVTLAPPDLAGAAYRSAARWRVTFPPEVAPLCPGSGLIPDGRWAWRGAVLAPTAGPAEADLEQWFQTGAEPPADAAPAADAVPTVSGRQPVPGRLTVVRLPWVGWVAGCSLTVLVGGLALTRVRPRLLGPAVGLIGVGLAAGAVGWPQVAGQAVGACQPGVWALLAVLALQVAMRWYHRRRVTHLPGFTRTRPPSVLTAPTAAATNGSAAVGSRASAGSRSGGSVAVPMGIDENG